MRALLALLVLSVAAAGCISASEPATPLEAEAPAVDPVMVAEAAVLTWDGRILASPLGFLAHNRDTEPLVAGVQSEGFVLDITEPPTELMVEMAWTGTLAGDMLMMVSSPSIEGKGVEYFTEFATEGPLCLMVPAAEIIAGKWQVMAHTRGTVDATVSFTVTTHGGAATIPAGEPHSSAEATETTEGEALPCEGHEH